MKIYEVIADMVAAEGIKCHFTLLGDANMYFAQQLEKRGALTIHVRHEHCACSMAMSYALARDDVGFCSVTCGPGISQLGTALPAAVRASIPLVVFAGESPMHSAWYNQEFDQGPFVRACGAKYIPVHSAKLLARRVQDAFEMARRERCPVVLGVPMDLQKTELTDIPAYRPSVQVMPAARRTHPDPDSLAAAVEMIKDARRVVVVGGRGMIRSQAGAACRRLARDCSGLLGTTLPARGAFHEDEFDIGIIGGFSGEVTRDLLSEADLVVAVGASLAHHTVDGGKLFGAEARTIQIDAAPRGINQGRVVADLYVEGDARASVDEITELLAQSSPRGDWRSKDLAERIRTQVPDSEDFELEPGTLDPREVIRELDSILPKDWEMVNSSGHCSYFAAHMYGRPAETFHTIREFGAIGNGLSYACGVAAARPDNTVVLFDGDGSFLMHSQELDTMRRHGLRILVCVLNDGAYGSEIHKLRSEGFGDGGAVFGRGDLAGVARGHGVSGRCIDDLTELGAALKEFMDGKGSAVWDLPVSDTVVSPVLRRAHPPRKG